MHCNLRTFSYLMLALATLGGCSSEPPASATKKAAVPLQKIQGKIQLLEDTSGAGDGALNAGGPTVFLWEGKQRYRLFTRKPADVVNGKYYVVEGLNAQKIINEIGDPDEGRHGYPLLDSCAKVIKQAWTGMSFDEVDVKATVLRARAARYPARPIFLVVKIDPLPDDSKAVEQAKKDEEDKNSPIISVPAEKQRAALTAGSLVAKAPLFEPKGDKVKCKAIIDREGKFSELETGAQLCEAFDWAPLRFTPATQAGKPVRVRTEIEITYEPRVK